MEDDSAIDLGDNIFCCMAMEKNKLSTVMSFL